MASSPKRRTPRTIAVAGGKGGVGKTTIAANLAHAFARGGKRVVAIDVDLGAANLHTALGVVHPQKTLADYIDHGVDELHDCFTQVSPLISLVAGTSRPGSANLGAAQKLRLLRAISRLDADVVIIDVGAGTSYTVVDLMAAADHKMLVMCPQLTSLHNAYALLKACVHRVIRKHATDETHQQMIDSALAHESKTRSVQQLLGVIRPMDADLANSIVDTLTRFGAMLVGNQLNTLAEADALRRMTPLIHDQLLVHAPLQSGIRRSGALAGSLTAGVGVIATRTTDDASMTFRQLADSILALDLAHLRGEARTSQQKTMPLWIQRGLEADAAREAPVESKAS
ncbi:MAG TPA: AAA family ATPase [Kofleriaceae bacterium]|jgi:flagellar biosynthesis protein FlhG